MNEALEKEIFNLGVAERRRHPDLRAGDVKETAMFWGDGIDQDLSLRIRTVDPYEARTLFTAGFDSLRYKIRIGLLCWQCDDTTTTDENKATIYQSYKDAQAALRCGEIVEVTT
jgi:hypothetical protein